MSQSTISRIQKDLFNNITIKLDGSSFAKCSICDKLQEFILKSPKGSPEYVEFVKQWEEHLAHQQSCHRLFGAWRKESKRNPSGILCIIHDKMNTAKIALPWMRITTNATQGLGQLPMNVIGMVSHGHRMAPTHIILLIVGQEIPMLQYHRWRGCFVCWKAPQFGSLGHYLSTRFKNPCLMFC